MRFGLEGQEVEVRGDPILTHRVVTPKALLKEKEIETMSLVYSLSQAELIEGDLEERILTKQETRLKQVLGDFEWVFQEPYGAST